MVEQARQLLNELHKEKLDYGEYSVLWDALDFLESERDAAIEDLRIRYVTRHCETCGSKLICKDSEEAIGGCKDWNWRGR